MATGVPASLHYAAPFFSSLDPEERNNRQFTGSLSYPASTKRTGTHDVKGGGEFYQARHTGGNSQSSTGYVFQSDYLVANGKPLRAGRRAIAASTCAARSPSAIGPASAWRRGTWRA